MQIGSGKKYSVNKERFVIKLRTDRELRTYNKTLTRPILLSILSTEYDKVTEKQRNAIKIRLWHLQEYKCPICEKDIKNYINAHLDHCHNTGLIRGLLCGRCNTGLGMFKDNKYTLINAIKYITSVYYE